MLKEKNNFALVRKLSSALEKAGPGAKRVLSGMVADTLALVPKQQAAPSTTRFRIGDYELCEPDYRQVLVWAAGSSLEPAQVIKRLFDQSSLFHDGRQLALFPQFEGTAIERGRFINLNWDLELLPVENFEWIEGLEIIRLRLVSPPDQLAHLAEFSPHLPRLTHLFCNRLGLGQLELSGTPHLVMLDCSENELERIEFSLLRNLQKLKCYDNHLTELEMANLPALESLSCGRNNLSELDLMGAMRLKSLSCHGNGISSLNLSRCLFLRRLWCHNNQLSELEIRHLDDLNLLDCSHNDLEQLELPHMSNLTSLKCSGNRLTELNLHGVPSLWEFHCDGNQIGNLDLGEVRGLTRLHCRDNQIDTLDIRPLLSLEELDYDEGKTLLIQRTDQHF